MPGMGEIQQLVDMGFAEAEARRVLVQVNGNVEQAVERLLSGAFGGDEPPARPPARVHPAENEELQLQQAIPNAPGFEAGNRDTDRQLIPAPDAGKLSAIACEDQDLSTALEMSIRDQRGETGPSTGSTFAGGTPSLREAPPKGALAEEAAARERELPCGLRNIGNTCYVNSFLQTLLHIDEFRQRILRYRSPAEQATSQCLPEPEREPLQTGAREVASEVANANRREHCIRLAGELRHLFAYGLFTMRSCIDPTRLLGELVDEKGQKLPIGSQEDVGEFMLKFLERLDEGLRAGSFIDEEPSAEDAPAPASTNNADAEKAAAPEDTVGGTEIAEATPSEKENKPPPLQSLFFGQQVQIFSYREGPGGSAADSSVAAKGSTPEAGGKEASPLETAADAHQPPPSAEADAAGGDMPSASELPPLEPQVPEQSAPVSSSEEGRLVVSEEKGEFLQIFLDVKHKDLYSAWEAANCTQVEYTTPSGSSTDANTNIWIERLPKLLSFQLQRVVFDHEKKVQVKVDESFDFDLTIYVDRFLLENREPAQEVASRVRELRRRRDELLEALARFQDFQGRPGLGVVDVLGMAAECITANAAQAATGTGASGNSQLELCDPNSVPEASTIFNTAQDAPSAVQILRSLRESCLAQEAALTREIDHLSTEVTDSHKDLRKYPFELHAIWVHQGIAGSGHYWAYVRDWQNERWIRYDDALVSVVSWEDVRAAAVGKAGSNTSAYVLVYVEKELALEQSKKTDQPAVAVLRDTEAVLPSQLVGEIHLDNSRLQEEQAHAEERLAEQELRHHAEAIFQHYAGLIHKWEPQKRLGDRGGNPHDPNMRKFLQDSALMSFQLFLYRLQGEQEVWTHLLTQSIEAQRQERQWPDDEHERVLYFLATTLRSQKCYANMLRDLNTPKPRCELQPLDMAKLSAQYNVVLIQAHIIDEALQSLKDDTTQLLSTVGCLAFVWARWNLEAEDKFRQNEVLLIMSTLIYNTINYLHRHRDAKTLTEPVLALFSQTCEYFLMLLIAVEWPNTWKQPLITRIQALFPHMNHARNNSFPQVVQKDQILNHPFTQVHNRLEIYESSCPAPGQEFFDRHRVLYQWLMQSDEAVSREYVLSIAPSLREQIPVGLPAGT